ncbi:MAG: transporter substrate-binding domain-containing protein [Oscillospiraceae bacterium]|nr:transporter substrate-binding domain-containing protein [Oscillospiraceae bacterium]
MKKLIAILTVTALVLCLCAGCGSSSSTTTTTDTSSADTAAADTAASADDAAADTSADTAADDASADAVASGVEDGVLTIAMECAYAPYNWTQYDDSNGAVPISGTSGEYANGYDVMIAKMICEANGWDLEVIRTDWDSLVPGVQTGIYDAVIAGQSMTEERMEEVDFAGPYFYASIVCVTLEGSDYADAQGLSDLAGGTCTAQIATIWYDSMLGQIPDAKIQTAAETAPAMLMALETGAVDFVCTDMPTALAACAAYDDMVLLDFTGSDDNFDADEGEINIGVSLMKGNTVLKDAIDSVLSTMTADDFNELMDEAIAIQPLSE